MRSPLDAEKLVALAPTLGAKKLELSISVSGTTKDGGTLNFAASGVKPNHPAKPLSIGQTVFNALVEGSQYEAELLFDFGAEGRTGMHSALEQAREQAPVDIFVVAHLGKALGVAA